MNLRNELLSIISKENSKITLLGKAEGKNSIMEFGNVDKNRAFCIHYHEGKFHLFLIRNVDKNPKSYLGYVSMIASYKTIERSFLIIRDWVENNLSENIIKENYNISIFFKEDLFEVEDVEIEDKWKNIKRMILNHYSLDINAVSFRRRYEQLISEFKKNEKFKNLIPHLSLMHLGFEEYPSLIIPKKGNDDGFLVFKKNENEEYQEFKNLDEAFKYFVK